MRGTAASLEAVVPFVLGGELNQATERVGQIPDRTAGNPKNLGPFASAAEPLWHAGLCPIPVGGEDGKKPLVAAFTKWKRRPGLGTIRKWIAKFPEANVGVVTGGV